MKNTLRSQLSTHVLTTVLLVSALAVADCSYVGFLSLSPRGFMFRHFHWLWIHSDDKHLLKISIDVWLANVAATAASLMATAASLIAQGRQRVIALTVSTASLIGMPCILFLSTGYLGK